MRISPLNQRRWRNFKRNRRAFWSLDHLFGAVPDHLFAEFVANDKPIARQLSGRVLHACFQFYPETAFGGDFRDRGDLYAIPRSQCLIVSAVWNLFR